MFNQLADKTTLEVTKNALEKNGFRVTLAETGQEAKNLALRLIPKGAEVFALQSMTLKALGLFQDIDESGNYNSVRQKLNALDRKTQGLEMQKLGAAPEYALGSVHAITQDGKILIASNTGSQLPADAFGASHLIWIVGTQKIVPNEAEGKRRIYEYILPLENERINKLYNLTSGSFVSKILTFYRELNPNRINIVLVNEVLGF